MLMTGSQIVLEVLAEEKVDTVFGYPGGTILNVYDALYDNQLGIRHFITAHEQGAAHAADGYARATGKTGVVFATSGPGSTNLVTGIATAYMDSIPMVAITANVPNAQIGSDSFQEVYITGITMPITKHNFVVRRVEDLADTIRQAFSIANSGRPGPVLVDIPKDVTAASCEFLPAPAPAAPERPAEIDPAVIAEVAALINAAERPVIHFGGGVIGSGASPLIYELAHRASIPACHTIMGTGVLSYNDPLNMGMVGMHGNISAGLAINGADLLLVIGARFSDRVATKPSDFARRARIVQIDIDRSEINKNIHIDYSIVGDVGRVLEAVLPLIERKEHPAWRLRLTHGGPTMSFLPQAPSTEAAPLRHYPRRRRAGGRGWPSSLPMSDSTRCGPLNTAAVPSPAPSSPRADSGRWASATGRRSARRLLFRSAGLSTSPETAASI